MRQNFGTGSGCEFRLPSWKSPGPLRSTRHFLPGPVHSLLSSSSWPPLLIQAQRFTAQHSLRCQQTLEAPSAWTLTDGTSADHFLDAARSQCHSATPEHHPAPSPPTTQYLETILFTDSLTLELAAAQLCGAWHGLSLGSPSFSTRKLAPPARPFRLRTTYLRITTNAMPAALCNATSQRSSPSQFSAPTSIRARHTHYTAPSCPIS